MKKLILVFVVMSMCSNLFGQKNGQYKSTYDNGQTEEIGEFKNDERTGVWKSYYENGQLDDIGEYKNGKQIGTWKSYKENGQLTFLVTYDNNGLQSGLQESYHNNGQLRKTGEFKNDEKIGIWKGYGEDGVLLALENYNTSIYKYFYDSGELSTIADNNYPIRGGLRTFFHKNGKIEMKQELVDDYMIRTTYYDNGQLESIYNIKDTSKKGASLKIFSGRSIHSRIGIGKEYDRDGKLISEVDYDAINTKKQ